MEQLQWIFTASFHGSIVILAVLALRLLLRRAPKKYVCMLWLLVGIRLLLPFRLESGLSLQPEPEQLPAIRQELTGALIPGMAEPSLPEAAPPPVTQPMEAPDFSPTLPQTQSAPEQPEKASFSWDRVLPWAYWAVVGAFGGYCLGGYLRLRRRVRFAVKIPGGWECQGLDTAFILGFVRPKIYIPMGMDPETRRFILAHERTHLEKGDHWIKLIGFFALALHWFNPLVWLSYFLLCRDIEMACDERVIRFLPLGERKAYSHALLTCSSSRTHYAVCPVAFGEVNVKNRILSVLNYRKPSFWISLVSVIAIVAVAVTLVTSPRSAEEPVPSETAPAAQESAPAPEEGYCTGMEESQISYTCEKAWEALRDSQSYYLTLDKTTVSTSENYGNYQQLTHYRRYGSSYLAQNLEDGTMVTGFLEHEGKSGYSMGTPFILWSEGRWGSDDWMDSFSPGGKMISFPQGTGVIAGDRVRYHAQWTQEDVFGSQIYQGDFTYVFREDGSISQIFAEYFFSVPDGTVTESVVITLQPEAASDTLAYIQAVVDSAIDGAQYQEYLEEQEIITDVPSNKTSYDKDFMLGSGDMQWKFFGEEGHVRIGAEDLSPTGLTLMYSEADDVHASLTAEEGYWLEQLVEGTWSVIGEYPAPERAIQVGWTTTDRYSLTWQQSLEGGFYRLGRYHTMTLNGQEETIIAYAKFRLYSDGEAELMAQARELFSGFLAQDSWHIQCTDYMNVHEQEEYYITEEAWKSGTDYLKMTLYPYRDGSGYWGKNGGMWRDGIRYSLEWAGNTVSSPITSWKTNTYMDEFNFTMWSYPLEWYDAQVEAVWKEGEDILIQSYYDFDDQYEATQTVLELDSGRLTGMLKRYLPTRDCPESDMVVSHRLIVMPTIQEEIVAVIRGQDLTEVPAFSWAEDRAAYPEGESNVRSRNFVNVSATAMAGTQAVVQRALQDCTLPAAGNLEPGTNVSKAYFDPAERIWKVEFTASWDSTVYQAVYLTEQGITIRTVTLELDPIA